MFLLNHRQKILLCVLSIIFCHNSIHAQSKRKARVVAKTPAIDFSQKSLTPRQIADKVLQSTVLIVTQDKEGEPISQGSGFFFGNGLVATNLHVFKRASQGYIKLHNSETKYEISEIVGFDIIHDLCVFKTSYKNLSALSLETSVKLSVGADVWTHLQTGL